ncbi:hypothetical protein FS749_003735 [Ceratobasidium sp. UAMH 11750]|nr:hypothetical protein FS749_003735 [Ceratobasidium sp. UAMH 11750]
MLLQASRTVARVSRIQQRSLASTVLFTKTPEQWQEQTVAQLKSEARRRGLGTRGTKSKLIERLVAHSQNNEQPAAPTGAPALPSGPARQRWISSSSAAQAEATTDKFKPRWSRNLDVKMPETPEEADEGPVIPFLAQKFDSRASESASPPQEVPDNSPRVVTVASAATHIGGGPKHAIHESSDAHTIEVPSSSERTGGSSLNLEGLFKELGAPLSFSLGQSGDAIREVLEPAIGGISAPTIGKDTTNVKEAQRELNEEEQRGLWVLGGIVAGGLILGGLGNKKSPFKKEKH